MRSQPGRPPSQQQQRQQPQQQRPQSAGRQQQSQQQQRVTPRSFVALAPEDRAGRREAKKAGRRGMQAAAAAAKAAAEDTYFRECQATAQRSGEARAAQSALSGAEADRKEAALFATQGTQGIDFNKYSELHVDVSGPGANAAPPLADFASLSLPGFLSRNIGLMRYRAPTPIQKHAVPLALAGCDLMCCAQTGSGKTMAFLLPICAALAAPDGASSTVGTTGAARPQAVVMAPTRELAVQIELEAEKLSSRSALRCVTVYGGANQRAQARNLALGVDLIVATPGRLIDFVGRGVVQLGSVRFLVLDEADRMLDMGFEPQIRQVVAHVPPKEKRQTLLFSATFPPPIQTLARQFLRACAPRLEPPQLHARTSVRELPPRGVASPHRRIA
jgi:ATP-dependent RNA helicase DDX3X